MDETCRFLEVVQEEQMSDLEEEESDCRLEAQRFAQGFRSMMRRIKAQELQRTRAELTVRMANAVWANMEDVADSPRIVMLENDHEDLIRSMEDDHVEALNQIKRRNLEHLHLLQSALENLSQQREDKDDTAEESQLQQLTELLESTSQAFLQALTESEDDWLKREDEVKLRISLIKKDQRELNRAMRKKHIEEMTTLREQHQIEKELAEKCLRDAEKKIEFEKEQKDLVKKINDKLTAQVNSLVKQNEELEREKLMVLDEIQGEKHTFIKTMQERLLVIEQMLEDSQRQVNSLMKQNEELELEKRMVLDEKDTFIKTMQDRLLVIEQMLEDSQRQVNSLMKQNEELELEKRMVLDEKDTFIKTMQDRHLVIEQMLEDSQKHNAELVNINKGIKSEIECYESENKEKWLKDLFLEQLELRDVFTKEAIEIAVKEAVESVNKEAAVKITALEAQINCLLTELHAKDDQLFEEQATFSELREELSTMEALKHAPSPDRCSLVELEMIDGLSSAEKDIILADPNYAKKTVWEQITELTIQFLNTLFDFMKERGYMLVDNTIVENINYAEEISNLKIRKDKLGEVLELFDQESRQQDLELEEIDEKMRAVEAELELLLVVQTEKSRGNFNLAEPEPPNVTAAFETEEASQSDTNQQDQLVDDKSLENVVNKTSSTMFKLRVRYGEGNEMEGEASLMTLRCSETLSNVDSLPNSDRPSLVDNETESRESVATKKSSTMFQLRAGYVEGNEMEGAGDSMECASTLPLPDNAAKYLDPRELSISDAETFGQNLSQPREKHTLPIKRNTAKDFRITNLYLKESHCLFVEWKAKNQTSDVIGYEIYVHDELVCHVRSVTKSQAVVYVPDLREHNVVKVWPFSEKGRTAKNASSCYASSTPAEYENVLEGAVCCNQGILNRTSQECIANSHQLVSYKDYIKSCESDSDVDSDLDDLFQSTIYPGKEWDEELLERKRKIATRRVKRASTTTDDFRISIRIHQTEPKLFTVEWKVKDLGLPPEVIGYHIYVNDKRVQLLRSEKSRASVYTSKQLREHSVITVWPYSAKGRADINATACFSSSTPRLLDESTTSGEESDN